MRAVSVPSRILRLNTSVEYNHWYMPNRLVVRLLGAFEVDAPNGKIAPFEAATARGLLAYLAANNPHSHSRSQLASLLWGADAGPTGLTNLRSALRRVRQAITLEDRAAPCLMAGRDTIQLNPDVGVYVDLEEFEAHLAAVQAHPHLSVVECRECADRQRQAVALFRGDFLSDLDIASDAFEQWRTLMQDRCRRLVMRALYTLAEHEARTGSLSEAERFARRQLALERWNEESHRQLMRILLATGRRSAALAQYDVCRQVLRTELGVVPSEETDLLYEQLLAGAAPTAVRRLQNPYKGLAAFGVADAANYFGREQMAQVLVERIGNEPLMALIGPSGSGKSSVIYAGLASALSAGSQVAPDKPNLPSARWQIVSMRPGAMPLQSLAEALPALGLGAAQDTWESLLLQGQLTLPALFTACQTPDPDPKHSAHIPIPMRRLLIVDQFEEVFTLCHDITVRSAFVRFLLSVLDAPGADPAPVVVLLAMRADFMGQALQDRNLATALQQYSLLLPPMVHQELRRAIAEPARLQGVVFEPGLVERLLADVGSEPGQLPLLQFALTTLWQRQQDGWLTHATYDAIGGVRGALAEYTDETYLQLSLPDQQAARRVFLSLVEPGLDAHDVRRIATRAEIGDEQWPIVQRLADARLLVTDTNLDGNETAEMAHEALIREWNRLREWMEADRTFRNWQQQMRLAAEYWRQSSRDDGTLLRGGRLAESERWLIERHTDIAPLVREYVEAGVLLHQRHLQEEAAQQEQNVLQMQVTAAAEHRRAEAELTAHMRLRRLTIGIAVASLFALGAAILALQAEQRAEKSALVAQSRRLVAQAINVMHSQPDLALLLGLEALRLDNSIGNKMDLYTELQIDPMLGRILHGVPSPVKSLDLLERGEVVISTEQGAIVVWDTASGVRRAVIDVEQGKAAAVVVSPDGRHYATLHGQRITLWDAETQSPLFNMDGNSEMLAYFAFTRDGKSLLSAGADGRVLLWDVASGYLVQRLSVPAERSVLAALDAGGTTLLLGDSREHPDELLIWDAVAAQQVGEPLVGHTDAVHGFAVSPNTSVLATASFDGSVRLWDTATGEALGSPLVGHEGRVLFVAFSHDGRTLASGGTDAQVLLWDVASHERLGPPLIGHSNWVRAGSFSADGALLATGDQTGNVLLWNLHTLRLLHGHTDRVRSLALSPDQSTLVTSGFDKQLIVWDAASLRQRKVITTPHTNAIISVAYSPDGVTFVSVDAGGRIAFWNTATWQTRFPLQQVSDMPLISLTFSPDGKTVAAGGFDGTVHLWDVATGVLRPQVLRAYTGDWALSVRFDPSGRRLATGGKDGVIKIWDVASGASIGAPVLAHESEVTDLVFTPDGVVLISAGQDGAIRFWDVATGEEAQPPLFAGSAQIWSLHYANDQPHHLLALSGDGTVADWDTDLHVLNRPLIRTSIETEEMKVAGDGAKTFLASTRAVAAVLVLDQREWIDTACEVANRTLSLDEWRTYMNSVPYQPACRK